MKTVFPKNEEYNYAKLDHLKKCCLIKLDSNTSHDSSFCEFIEKQEINSFNDDMYWELSKETLKNEKIIRAKFINNQEGENKEQGLIGNIFYNYVYDLKN